MMDISFNTQFTNTVERDIAPPMKMVTTIPVKVQVDGKRIEGVVIYVGTSAFLPAVGEAQFKEVIAAMVARLGNTTSPVNIPKPGSKQDERK